MKRLLILPLLCLLSIPAVAQQKANYYARIKIDLNDYLLSGSTGPGLTDPYGMNTGGEDLYSPPTVDATEPTTPPTVTPPKGKAPPFELVIDLQVKQRDEYIGPDGGRYWIILHGLQEKNSKAFVPKEDIQFVQFDSERKRFQDKKAEFDAGGKRTAEYLELAKFALQRGLNSEFVATMQELVAKQPNDKIAQAFDAVHKKLQVYPTSVDPSAQGFLRSIATGSLNEVRLTKSHYTVYSNLRSSDPALKKRLEHLERTYVAFFYWFALQGKVIEPPNYRLAVVLGLEPDSRVFVQKHFSYTDRLPVDSGFLIRQENVMFLNAKPISEKFRILEKNNAADWNRLKTNYKSMLNGDDPPEFGDPLDIPKLQTRTLIQKVLEMENEAAITTHEAVRQLLAATGLLPRNVAAGEWVRYGIASFFETPREAFFPGTTLPSWTNLIEFQVQFCRDESTFEQSLQQADLILLRVVCDDYFRQAQHAFETADSAKKFEKAREKLRLAQATAWGLTYYLMNNRPNQVLAYLDELKKLPRDVEFDTPVLSGCFARAFQMESKGAKTGLPIDLPSLAKLGTTVFRLLDQETVDIRPMHRTIYEQRLESVLKK
jgi:hypothetical protein